MRKTIILISLLMTNIVFAQVGINNSNSAPDTSAMLDVQSTSKGLLIPRMTASDRDNISAPATGLTVYVTDDDRFYYYDGSQWNQLQTGGKTWLLAGNGGTNGTEFLGTTDAQPLILKTNNTERIRINENGAIGVSTAPDDHYLLYAKSGNNNTIGRFESSRTSSDDIGVKGLVANTDYYGIGGVFQGGWYGLKGIVYPTGSNTYYGISAIASGGSGSNYGLKSYVSGSGSNYGVYSSTNGGSTNYAGYFLASTPADGGCTGYFFNQNDTGNGIFAISNNLGTLYYHTDGEAIAATGKLVAISGYSENDDSNTICIRGLYKGTNNYDATGVMGYSMPATYYGYGVKGYGGWMGVVGETDSDGLYGVYSNGDLGASGTKSFMIDHPLDPANKYLKHFSIESDEVLNVYRGNIILNKQGEATVQLPDYFRAINKNFSYTLTPIGQPAPNIYIAKEIDEQGEFKIAGGHPGQKISWYVYAERNDPYLQQHPERRQVELVKKAKERNKYLMPELYNQPKEKAMFFENTVNKTTRQEIELPKEDSKKL